VLRYRARVTVSSPDCTGLGRSVWDRDLASDRDHAIASELQCS